MPFLTHDFHPFSILEDYGFRNVLEILNPTCQLPLRKNLTNTLLSAENEEVYIKTKEVMKNVKSFTLTTDSWKSPNVM